MANVNPFNVISYTDKNSGEKYFAKKLSITNPKDGEKIDGIYVWNQNAKPDKDGKIDGKFMSTDTFMKELADKLPAYNTDTFQKSKEVYQINNIGCTTHIEKNDDGTYTVTSKSSTYGAEPKTTVISEDEFQEKYADKV